MYWRFTTVPELSDLPEVDQRRLWAEAGRDRSNRLELPLTALCVIAAICCVLTPLSLLLTLNSWFRWAALFIAIMAMTKLIDMIMIWQRRRTIRRLRAAG